MISIGTKIQSNSDRLERITIAELVQKLSNPDKNVRELIKRLRIVREVDIKQYSILKRELPYFVCASFNPPLRKIDNFAYTEYFVIDIDHISEHGMNIDEIKVRLSKDPRVHIIFISPGEDGLKVMFKLSEKCYDAGVYRIFYKKFASQWAIEHKIEEALDYSTRDVARACFLSWDPDLYYNPLSDTISISSIIDLDNSLELFDIHREIQKEEKNKIETKTLTSEPDEDALKKIKEKLSIGKKVQKENIKQVFVPQQVERIISDLTSFVNEFSIELYEAINIQYGKKLRFRLDSRKAELNLFYGKKGFTVVQCPKSGTSKELSEICQEIVYRYIDEITI